MNRTVRLVIVIATAVILVLAVIFGVYYGVSYFSDDNIMADVINKGNAAMASADYDGAINAYIEALELEPENEDIKNAIANAYILKAGALSDTDEAIAAYQESLLYNKANTNAYWGVANIYESRGDEDNVLLALQTGYNNTGDENMRIKCDNIEIERARIKAEEEAAAADEAERKALEESHNDLLSALFEVFDSGSLDDVKSLIRTDEYVTMTDEVIGRNNSFYYGDRDDNGKRSGRGIAVYADGYYYFGDFEDDERSGDGRLIRAVYAESSAIGSFIYEGKWENDKPNGQGTCTSNFYGDRISAAELSKQVISGEYKDGLENGSMTLNGTKKDGGSVKYSYTSADGVAKKSSDEDSGVKGQYIIATSKDGKSNLTSDGSLRGVEGFTD